MQGPWTPSRIEDYALLGDTHTAALVSKNGSIDWLCLPRFDSPACFASLLGTERHGHWMLRPRGEVRDVRREYRDGTMILETTFRTDEGEVTLIDFMPRPSNENEFDLMRIVKGVRGRVSLEMEFVLRFDYGAIVPWVRRTEFGLRAFAGPNGVELRTPVELEGRELRTYSEFSVGEGDQVPFTLTWHPSHLPAPKPIDPFEALDTTEDWWSQWSGRYSGTGDWAALTKRSLLTLKALTYEPTGGIVAAPTTSLPEALGGVRNWDYRYCWLRDATFTLYALLISGFADEAAAWRDWLLRAVAGSPSQLQIMFGIAGERLLPEVEADWLPGYANSSPVRLGNAAHRQFQLDVYGEIMDSFHVARRSGIQPQEDAWLLQKELMSTLERVWDQKDEGIWEVRGPSQHFVHSKVMAWVAADRAVKATERFGLDGPAQRWRQLRETIHAEVLEKGYDTRRGTFVQSYGSKELDAALLMIPLVGFLPADDQRVQGTINAIQQDLMVDGFVRRYRTEHTDDGLPAGEAFFLPCSFWMADALVLSGRRNEALEVFNRLTAICNDVGLLAEEYDPVTKRQLGNFPQAFTHVGLVNTANNLAERKGPAQSRAQQ